MNDFLDLFKNNTRCNMAIPNNNNGTIRDELALCNHIYDAVSPKVSWNEFLSIYQKEYKVAHVKDFYDTFNKSDYNRVYFASPMTSSYNNLLSKLGCPYSFSTQPRAGYVVIFEKILKVLLPVVFGFSINPETRKSFYVQDYVFQLEDNNKSCHSKEDEIKIIRWLHENNKVDITPCMLQDSEIPTLNCEGMKPSQEVIDLLKSVYQKVRINK